MSLVEVMFAIMILTMILCGVLQAMLQSRRMTEGSVRQASVASLVQGYLEQMKSIKYADVLNELKSSPSSTPADADAWEASFSLPVKDASLTTQTIYLAVGAAPTSLPVISTLPTDESMHVESVDIDNSASTVDDSQLKMWVWVNDLTGTNVVKCKSIVVVYQWSVKDGGKTTYYSDMMRTIRSIVPTDG
ncbi:MAG TPA: hypothetical protein VM029_15060 [Opitutaceae bacterium]|nr:hypothetical protein [Opitutaceae bacterium]